MESSQLIQHPRVIVIAGPNGAGKSTASYALLEPDFPLYINPDIIARGVNPYNPEQAAFAVGRIVHQMMRDLMKDRKSFSFETTLSGKTYARALREMKVIGYQTEMIFFSLKSPDLAVLRVAERVRDGGHNIPEETIRRRFGLGLHNFFNLYEPLFFNWRIYDNSTTNKPALIAAKVDDVMKVYDSTMWEQLLREHGGRYIQP